MGRWRRCQWVVILQREQTTGEKGGKQLLGWMRHCELPADSPRIRPRVDWRWLRQQTRRCQPRVVRCADTEKEETAWLQRSDEALTFQLLHLLLIQRPAWEAEQHHGREQAGTAQAESISRAGCWGCQDVRRCVRLGCDGDCLMFSSTSKFVNRPLLASMLQ
jgi:hypothetical protein